MAKYALIGGKANKPKPTNKIERFITSLIKKERPRILYCPYAAVGNYPKSIASFHRLMEGINADIVDLDNDNIKDFDELLNEADILYIGGGHCDDLVELFKAKGLDKILLKYINSDKVFAGSSAGAMLFSTYSMGDKYMYSDNFHNHNYKMVKCLGILDMILCPHYQNEDLIVFNDAIREYDSIAFGLEEDTCLIVDGNAFQVIKEEGYNSLYYFNKNKLMIPLYEGNIYKINKEEEL